MGKSTRLSQILAKLEALSAEMTSHPAKGDSERALRYARTMLDVGQLLGTSPFPAKILAEVDEWSVNELACRQSSVPPRSLLISR
jgi:hypothetical protein